MPTKATILPPFLKPLHLFRFTKKCLFLVRIFLFCYIEVDFSIPVCRQALYRAGAGQAGAIRNL
jgi:hypothetical protein